MFPINPINFPQESPASTDNTAVPFCQMGNAAAVCMQSLSVHQANSAPTLQQTSLCYSRLYLIARYALITLWWTHSSLMKPFWYWGPQTGPSIHWSPWLAGSSAAHIPLTAYWDPQSCSSTRHPQPGALQRAQPPSDLTQLPALLQHSCWEVN